MKVESAAKMGFNEPPLARSFNNNRHTAIVGSKECNFRSNLEHRVAVYLELLKIGGHIKDWAFEQTVFHFDNPILSKYLMDFDVIRPDGTFYYIEAKGMMDKHSRDRITVLLTEKPEVELWVVFQNKRDKVKFERKKIAKRCKRVCLLSELTRGIV